MTSLRKVARHPGDRGPGPLLPKPERPPRSPLHIHRGGRGATGVAGSPIHLGLGRNFLWTASGFAVYALMQWGVIIALAKFVDPKSVGAFTLATAIASPIVLFTNLQLKALQASDAQGDFRFPDYVSLRVVTSTIGFVAIAAIAVVSGYSVYVGGVIVIVGAMKCFESMSDVLYGLFQKHERFDTIATSLIIRSLASLVVVNVVVILTKSVLLVCTGAAIIWLLALGFYDVRRAKHLLVTQADSRRYGSVRQWVPFDKSQMRVLAKLALPMGMVMLLVSLNLNIPRLVIERDLGISQLGYFGAMAYPVFAGSLAVFALGESVVPRLSRDFISAPGQFVHVWFRLLLTALVIGVAGVVLVAIWGSELLGILYGPAYEQHGTAFTWLVVAAGLSYLGSANSYALTAARRLRIQVPLFLVVTATTLIGALLLVPRSGLVGAGLAMALSGLVHAVLAGVAVATAVSRRKRTSTNVSAPGGSSSVLHKNLAMKSLQD
jgi:O-antigen/teichoic acid export membrane protein